MSPASDVQEMQDICAELATLLRLPDSIQARTNELRRLFGRERFGWNRINEFVRGKARRVDGWEKDLARKVRDDIRREARQRREHEHLAWLAEQTKGMDGGAADVLQRLLCRAGYVDSPVAVPETEADADFDQSSGWGR